MAKGKRKANSARSTKKDILATITPGDAFSRISRDWKGVCKSREDLDEMDHFIEQECPEWV